MDILYSATILQFLEKVKDFAFDILKDEMQISTSARYFTYQGYRYRLNCIVFEHPSYLGTCCGDRCEIGLHKHFLLETEESIKHILRHELAHLITYLEHGDSIPHHGQAFKNTCNRYGWSADIAKASIPQEALIKQAYITKKIYKLLALSTSPHPEEAKQALQKAHYLLDKHHIRHPYQSDGETVLLRVLEKPRNSVKLHAIAAILRRFYVYPIFNRGRKHTYIEVLGDKTSTQIAAYIAHYLDNHFEVLWKQAKKTSPRLKGLACKHSFFKGLANGFLTQTPQSRSLITTDHHLVQLSNNIYHHLSHSRSSHQLHPQALKLGIKHGKTLNIHQAIAKNPSNTPILYIN